MNDHKDTDITNISRLQYSILGRAVAYILIIFYAIVAYVKNFDFSKVFQDGDYVYHMNHIRATLNALQDGQFIPQLDVSASNPFGYAWNVFYGPLPTYFATFFHLLTSNWTIVWNLTVIVGAIIAGITMFETCKEITSNVIFATVSSIIFMSMPYILWQILFITSLGSFYATAISPLVILGIYRLVQKDSTKSAAYPLIISVVVLVLSHNLSVVIMGFFGILLLLSYAHRFANKRLWITIGVSILMIFGLTAYFTLPLIEAKYSAEYNVFSDRFCHSPFTPDCRGLQTQSVKDLLTYSAKSSLSNNFILWILVLVCVVVTVLLARKRYGGLAVRLGVIATLSFFMNSYAIPWMDMPRVIDMIQFAWRFWLGFTVIAPIIFAITFAAIWEFIRARLKSPVGVRIFGAVGIIVLCLILAVCTIFSLDINQHRKTKAKAGTGQAAAENYPFVLDASIFNDGLEPHILNSDVKVKDYESNKSHVKFNITAKSDLRVEMPFIYYPGYKVILTNENGDKSSPEIIISKHGMVQFTVPKGFSGTVNMHYGLSTATKVGSAITVVSIFAGAGMLIYRRRKPRSETR